MEAQTLLGLLPLTWLVQLDLQNDRPESIDSQVWGVTQEDTRLGTLALKWEYSGSGQSRNEPTLCEKFRNKKAEVMNPDTRILPEAPVARGIKLETFWPV